MASLTTMLLVLFQLDFHFAFTAIATINSGLDQTIGYHSPRANLVHGLPQPSLTMQELRPGIVSWLLGRISIQLLEGLFVIKPSVLRQTEGW
jgi:hypothetical protein